jgi:hypothetical protein
MLSDGREQEKGLPDTLPTIALAFHWWAKLRPDSVCWTVGFHNTIPAKRPASFHRQSTTILLSHSRW